MTDRWACHYNGMIRDDGGIWVKETDLAAARAEIERLDRATLAQGDR